MKKILLSLLYFISTQLALCQNTNEFRFGAYFRDNSKKELSITPSPISEAKVELNLLLPEKPCVFFYIKNQFSKIYTPNQLPEFFFYFTDENDNRSVSPKEVRQITINYPFLYAKSPEDFVLVRLFKSKSGNERLLRLEKEKYLIGIKFIPLAVDTIPFISIPIKNSNCFKVIPESKIPIGDYGFILKSPSPQGLVVYDFSIED